MNNPCLSRKHRGEWEQIGVLEINVVKQFPCIFVPSACRLCPGLRRVSSPGWWQTVGESSAAGHAEGGHSQSGGRPQLPAEPSLHGESWALTKPSTLLPATSLLRRRLVDGSQHFPVLLHSRLCKHFHSLYSANHESFPISNPKSSVWRLPSRLSSLPIPILPRDVPQSITKPQLCSGPTSSRVSAQPRARVSLAARPAPRRAVQPGLLLQLGLSAAELQ